MRKIILTAVFILSSFIKLHATTLINKDLTSINLSNSSLYYLDENKTLTIKNIISQESNKFFIKNNSSSISPAYTKKTLWLKFSITNSTSDPMDTILDLPIPWINSIDLYIIRDDIIQKKQMGVDYPFYKRLIIATSYATPLKLKPKEKIDIIIKVKGDLSIIIAPIIYSKKYFEIQNSYFQTFNGALAGILLMTIFFSFFLFIRIKNSIFLYYSLFISSVFLVLGGYFGYSFQFIWPNAIYFNQTMISATISLYSLFGLLFTRNFLQIQINMPKIDKIVKYLLYILFMLFVSNFLVSDKLLITNVSMIFVSISSTLILLIAILAYIRKIPASKPFLYAWTLSNIASISASLLLLGTIGYSQVLYFLTGVAPIVDLILFSQALAERTLIVHKQNNELKNQNRDLKNLSFKDGLTNIYNRRYFDKFIEHSFNSKKRMNGVLSLIMIDIDNFKDYNDFYGHQAGDECLISITQAIDSQLNRSSDFIARYGGEEFVVLIDGDIEIAKTIAQKIQTEIRNLRIEHKKSIFKIVTVSQGLSSITANETSSTKELIAKADEALYTAKRIGRDNYTISDS